MTFASQVTIGKLQFPLYYALRYTKKNFNVILKSKVPIPCTVDR